ncbi:MAG TPA: hypothetical protein VE986_05910, partial [Hyphomicrobiales bacterium]|nr:hypothetical protein [Hyphomicrobiales bacterium]
NNRTAQNLIVLARRKTHQAGDWLRYFAKQVNGQDRDFAITTRAHMACRSLFVNGTIAAILTQGPAPRKKTAHLPRTRHFLS